MLDDHFVLQEASGSTASHPAYRRYHYAKQPLSVVDSGQGARFLSNDALGSVSDLTTASGTLYAKRQYDAWGQYRSGTAPAANQPKLGYTGHQFDPETGLVYARARYYDAESGIFLSRDSHEGELDEAPSLHRFAYAWGNPLQYTDFEGFDAGTGADNSIWEREHAVEVEQFMRTTQEQGMAPGTAEYYKLASQPQFTFFDMNPERFKAKAAAGDVAAAEYLSYREV